MTLKTQRPRLFAAVVGVTVLGTAGGFVGGSYAVAAAPTPSSGGSESVIVVLHDQLTSLPANRQHISSRRTMTANAQNAVLGRLSHLTSAGVSKLQHYTTVNAFSATMTKNQAASLASDPAVAAVIPNNQVAITVPSAPAASAGPVKPSQVVGQPNSTAVCPTDPSKPLLEPEALQDTNTASDDPSAKTAQQLTDGSGVKVAYIADAINPDNPDFIRANGDHVITDYKAFSADGPTPEDGGAEAYGDASAIAAQGLVSHDLSTFVNPAYPLPSGCNIRILGMAPGASIVALKIDFFTTSIIQAIDYAVSTDHVDVINESFGGNVVPDLSTRTAIALFNDMAVQAGATVTVSSGDAGTTSTIGNPATDPNVISVAANTNNRGYAQTGYAGARAFGNGQWVNDEISSLSSGGFTQSGGTVDLTAPGESGWAVCDAGAPECTNYRGGGSDVQLFGGTSQSAPLTAGAAALVISAYRSTHGGNSPSPALVKQLLTSTATDLGLPAFEQGSGLLNSRAAVEAALTYPGATSAAPAGVASNIALSKTQLNVSGAPGSTQSATVGVTNVGTKPLTVATSGRDFLTTGVSTLNTSIDASSTQTFPYPTTGAPWAYKKVPFTVPAGTDRMALQMIWAGTARPVGSSTVTPVVRVSLFDPSGTYVANSRPQGGAVSANYANLDLRKPVAGAWTAVIYTVGSASGYTGNVSIRNTFQRAVGFGSIDQPALQVAPGQTKNVTVSFTVPQAGGDTSYALTVASSDGHATSIPVVVRTVVPAPGTFAGTITGGNARAGSAAQSFTYAFDVPAGKADVGVGIRLASNPAYTLEAVLVDPNGETQAIDSNSYTGADGNISGQGTTVQLTSAIPMAGRWRLVILVVNPVPGAAFTENFTGTIGFNTASVTTTLPNSFQTVLPRGKTATAQVKVTNTGIAPITVQVDPRNGPYVQTQFVSPFGSQNFQLPAHAAPTFLVPPGTTGLTATSVAGVPAIGELLSGTQGIDVVGDLTAGKDGSTVSVASVDDAPSTVSSGIWFTDVNEVGPVGADGAPTADARVDLSGRTLAFDHDVTSSTGDFWAASVDPNADTGKPITIAPKASAIITLRITPTAAKGTLVLGALYVYTTPSFAYATFNTTGDMIARLPYHYKVG